MKIFRKNVVDLQFLELNATLCKIFVIVKIVYELETL